MTRMVVGRVVNRDVCLVTVEYLRLCLLVSRQVSSHGVNVCNFCPSEWRTALYVGDRKSLRPPPRFKDVFFSLTWMASLTPLSNQWSSLTHTPGHLQRSAHLISGVDVLLNLVQSKRCAIHLWMGCFVYSIFPGTAWHRRHCSVCVLVFFPWGGTVSVWGCWRVWTAPRISCFRGLILNFSETPEKYGIEMLWCLFLSFYFLGSCFLEVLEKAQSG